MAPHLLTDASGYALPLHLFYADVSDAKHERVEKPG
jgi:hypothetical protein